MFKKIILLVAIFTLLLSSSCAINKSTNTELILIPYRNGNKYGFCYSNKRVIIPVAYDEVGFFSEGLAPVRLNGKWGYIDSKGTLVIPTIYREVFPFTNGLALVCDTNGNFSFIDKERNIVIPSKNASYTLIPGLEGFEFSFSDGLYPVTLKDFRHGYIDNEGNLVISLPESFEYTDFFKEGFAVVRVNGKWGF